MLTTFSPTPFWVPPPAPTATTAGGLRIVTSFLPVDAIPQGVRVEWWPLSPSIQAAICSPASMILMGGASGGGKSDALVGDAMQEYWLPTFRGLLLRESLGEIEQIADRMKAVYEPLGANYRNRSGGGEWEFPLCDEKTRKPIRRKGGARLRYGYLARDADLRKYRGNQKSWIGIDESGMQPVKRVRAIMAWLAPIDPRLRPRVRLASNPGGVGASWQLAVFLRNRCPLHYPAPPLDDDPTRSVVPGKVYSGAGWSWPPSPSELVHMTTAFFPATVADNPFYGQQKIDVLRSQTPEIQMQLLHGCWCNAESLYFGFMRPEMQMPRQMLRPEWWWNHCISIDYGFKNSSAAAGLYATNEQGQTFGVAEIIERQMGAVEYAKLIVEKWIKPNLGDHPRRVEFVVMDPATDSHDDIGKSKYELMAEVFAEHGVRSVKAHKESSDNAQNLYQGLGTNMLVLTTGMPQTFTSISTRVIDERRAVLKVHGDPLDDCYDSCLVAGTMVATQDGSKPIEDVTAGEMVWTRGGLRKVLWGGETNDSAETWEARFSNGTTLRGTAAHPIFVEGKGYIRLDTVVYGDKISICPDSALAVSKQSCIAEPHSAGIPIPQAGITAATSAPGTTTGRPESRTYTERYTSTKWGRFLAAIRSIIRTKMYLTTPRQISSWSQSRSTPRCTPKSGCRTHGCWHVLVAISQRLGRWLQHGTVLQRDSGSTVETQRNYGRTLRPKAGSVRFAEDRTPPSSSCRGSDAAIIAKPRPAETLGLITNPEIAPTVAEYSPATSTSPRSAVHVVAINCCTGQRERVYNLSVEDNEEYYANGILVHNCAYFWNTYIRESKKPERLALQESLNKMRERGADNTTLARENLRGIQKIESKEKQQARGLPLRRER